ncbi:hypothetical protein [Spiroplasma tabanidicola]|uniref:Uncharacterized protein n=1 Tax=Spiroplasma tabanidicola TaxID=324079 RepID=A0A6I6CC16_9MOLU|nr:hypothetical protein [Spiroplasma tabanidicola]QGS51642.1 hypothetical protein STABA_v1c02760 [Spiroplasma tabanidicola]
MKNLLALLSSMIIATSSLSTITNSSVSRKPSDHNNSNLDNNGGNSDEGGQSNTLPNEDPSTPETPVQPEEPSVPADTRRELEEVIVNHKFENLKAYSEDDLRNELFNRYSELKGEVTFSQYKYDENEFSGSLLVSSNENSEKYKGNVTIHFSVYHYAKTDFQLEKKHVELRIGEQKNILVKNFNQLVAPENYPQAEKYDSNYLEVSFDKEVQSVVIKAKDVKEPPKDNALEVTLISADGRENSKQKISVTLWAKKVDFQLCENSINLKADRNSSKIVNISNFDDLYDSSNIPYKVEVDDNGKNYISASLTAENNGILISSINGYTSDKLKVTVIAKEHSEIIEVTLDCPAVKAVLEHKSVDMNIKEETYIKISNYDELYVQDNMPDKISVSDTNILKAELDINKKAIKITAFNKPVVNAWVKVWSNNFLNEPQTINVNINTLDVNFELENHDLSLVYNQKTSINVKNINDLYDADKNLPKQFEYNHDLLSVEFNEVTKQIDIIAKSNEATNQVIKVSSKIGHFENINYSITAPKADFRLKTHDAKLQYNSEVRIQVENINELYGAEKNLPSEFSGYDKDAINVSYDNVKNEVVIVAKQKEVASGTILVKSKTGHSEEISYSVSIPNVDFKLEAKEINLKYNEKTTLKVTNINDLYGASKNLPTKFSGYDTSAIDVSYDSKNNQVVIVSKQKEVANGQIIIESESGARKEVKFTVSIPNVDFKLEKTNVVLQAKTKTTIDVTNVNELYDAYKNLPTEFSGYDTNAVSVRYNRKNAQIVIEAKSKEVTNGIITVRSKEGNVETITYSITIPKVDFKLDTTSINLEVYKSTRIKVTNVNDLYDSDKNLPTEFSGYNKDAIDVSYDRSVNEIVIVAKDQSVNNGSITVRSKNGSVQSITYSITIPQVDFKLGSVSQMNAGDTQEIDVTNGSSLVHSDNYPSVFEFSKNGVVSASYDSVRHKIIVKSLSKDIFCRTLEMTIKSKNGRVSKTVKFDVIKQFDLSTLNGDLGKFDKFDATAMKNKFYELNKNIGFNKDIFDGLEIYEQGKDSAKIRAQSDLAKKWFKNSLDISYKIPPEPLVYNMNDSYDAKWTKDSSTVGSIKRIEDYGGVSFFKSLGKQVSSIKQEYTKMKLTFTVEAKWSKPYKGSVNWDDSNSHYESSEKYELELPIENLNNGNKTQIFKIEKSYTESNGIKDVAIFTIYITLNVTGGRINGIIYQDISTERLHAEGNYDWFSAKYKTSFDLVTFKN